MRLNGYMNPLLKSNRNFINVQHKLSNDRININSHKDTSIYVKNQISFDRGKEFLSNMTLISKLKNINGKEIKELKANNNVLNFEKGMYYKMKSKSGATTILTGGQEGNVYMPLDNMKLGSDFTLAPLDWHEITRNEQLFTYLSSDKTGYCAYSNFSNAEIKETLGRVGVEPGWFEIKNSGNSNKFYMLNDGEIYPEYQIEAERNGINDRDWFKDGYTKNSKFTLDGKDYKLDDQGHLHIPKGEGCVMEKLKRIK